MIRVTRWELIKAIAEAYKLYYLDDEKVDIPISIIYNKYGLSTTLRPKQRLADYEYLVLTISPGCFGDNVETIDDVYTWFIDYALIDIDYWINELITLDERSRLYQLEETIRQGLNTFVDVGNALLEIRDKRLYRQEYHTFEDYCREQWNMKQSRAYQFMDSAKVVGNLQSSTIVELLPINESQARPLTSLEGK